MSSNTGKILTVIVVLLFVIGAGVYLIGQDNRQQNGGVSVTPTPTRTGQQTPSPSPRPTSRPADVPQDWESFSPEDGFYTIFHPPEMNIGETAVGSTELQILGDTQPEQGTEIIDGIRMVIESGEHDEESFVAFVESEHMRMSDEPTTDRIIPMQLEEIAGKQAYWFIVTSLGENTHVYLPVQDDRFVHAFYLVEDPEDEGYQETVDTMLSSLRFD